VGTRFGTPAEETYGFAIPIVVAGVISARLVRAPSHVGQIDTARRGDVEGGPRFPPWSSAAKRGQQ
jgi:hypothetical protein